MGWFGKKEAKAAPNDDNHIENLFEKYDKDDSGAIDQDELKAALAEMKLPAYHAEEIFDTIDTNHDGKIDLKEFTTYVEAKESVLKKTFDKFRRGNDKISSEDMLHVLDDMHLHPTAQDIKKLMDIFDDDHSGEVSWDEFRDHLVLLNPADFSKIADEWMHYSGEHGATGGGTIKATGAKWHAAAAGGIGAAISRTCVAPLERLRMQMIADGAKFGGSNMALVKHVMKVEGIAGGWRGNGVNMVRILPQNAVAFGAKGPIKKAIEEQFGKGVLPTIAGSSLAGMVCISSVYPLDLARGRITTSPGVYSGLGDALMKISSQEGVGALFKGISHANIWAIPYYAATFCSYDAAKSFYVEGWLGEGDERRTVGPAVGLVLGMIGGCCGTVAGFPFESARRKMQLQGIGGRPAIYSGLFSCMSGVVRIEGVQGLFRGVSANIAKMAPAS
eukprot:CAMPEP_0118640684 /NCGR_PEP_ID=MMETSP0785-20121206/4883_1 /TAXON_ID=91992 /ORGANISM="Bolidomonas pacifica, Strain CCMP 1866" /LENGTH=444 /DNA_ID=CAMNT_0006532085 /DNA_START=10 /DNA_END=1341 /DNA_ORIENTATION=+